jgi:hypothetical protein
VVRKYPHFATISYNEEGTYDNGIYTPGMEVTFDFECNIQPGGKQYIVGKNGDMIPHSYTIFCDVFDANPPEGAKIKFFDKEFTIINLFKYQKHIEIRV